MAAPGETSENPFWEEWCSAAWSEESSSGPAKSTLEGPFLHCSTAVSLGASVWCWQDCWQRSHPVHQARQAGISKRDPAVGPRELVSSKRNAACLARYRAPIYRHDAWTYGTITVATGHRGGFCGTEETRQGKIVILSVQLQQIADRQQDP